MKEYVVLRIANKPNGTFANPISVYETEVDAWKEFYRQCGLAVDSENLTDAVIIMTKQGFTLDYKYFEH